MQKRIASAVISMGLLFGAATPNASAAVRRHHHYYHQTRSYAYYRHRRHVKTAKRVGIGASGGAVIGAIAGGGKGAGIGAAAGAGAGYLYDRHKRHEHR